MAITKIFEQRQSGGTSCFLIVGGDTINLGTSLSDVTAGVAQSVAITKMHWSGAVTITSGGVSIPLTGNGAWCQFNGWTPVECSNDITLTGGGTIFIEIKKLAGFTGRSDYSA